MGIDVCMSGLWNVLYMYGGRSKGDMYTLKIKKRRRGTFLVRFTVLYAQVQKK